MKGRYFIVTPANVIRNQSTNRVTFCTSIMKKRAKKKIAALKFDYKLSFVFRFVGLPRSR